MLQEERMRKIITDLSQDMIVWKKQWIDWNRTNEQYKREDTMDELTGDYQRTIEHTENMMIELDSFFYLEVPLIESNMILAWILKFWNCVETIETA